MLVAGVGVGAGAGAGAGAGLPLPDVEVPGAEPEVELGPAEGSGVPLDVGGGAEVDVAKGLAGPDPQPTTAIAAKQAATKWRNNLNRKCTYEASKAWNRFIQTRFASTLAT